MTTKLSYLPSAVAGAAWASARTVSSSGWESSWSVWSG